MPTLQLWNNYTREDVHGIFSPATTFVAQRGTWGLQGIVRVPARRGDWVFFVSFGKQQGDHVFDESITTDGVLSWQSQPSQRLADSTIRELIAHDDRLNTIHLFLRTNTRAAYTYLGTLGYLTHDRTREQPVYFQWQLLDWPPPVETLQRIELDLLEAHPAEARLVDARSKPANSILFVEAPSGREPRAGVSTNEFRRNKSPDYAAQDARNRALGLRGELLVFECEKAGLAAVGREDLASLVVHVSATEGDSVGYDIRSFLPDGNVRYIEVKTTEGGAETNFFLSAKELEFSVQNANAYALYRLFEFDRNVNTASAYILAGNVTARLDLRPTQFRAELCAANQ